MPPKKKASAISKPKPSPNDATHSDDRDAPDTVTNNRGKEFATTAASRRPTRAVAHTSTDTAEPLKKVASTDLPKKRGRPAKAPVDESDQEPEPPKKRGRPAKADAVAPAKRGRPAKKDATPALKAAPAPTKKRGRVAKKEVSDDEQASEDGTDVESEPEPAKKRGRGPAKKKVSKDEHVSDDDQDVDNKPKPSKKRGRPAKKEVAKDEHVSEDEGSEQDRNPEETPEEEQASEDESDVNDEPELPKKRGRGRPPMAKPAKASTKAPAKKPAPPAKKTLVDAVPPEDKQPAPKKRGRPPKGGQTTKIAADDQDAAEQLEEELQEEADEEADEEEAVVEPPKRGRGRPKGKATTKAPAKKAAATEEEVVEPPTGKQYWLMKAEQDGHDEKLKNGETFNTKFTIDDLRSKTGPEPWDGVRNPTASKNMRQMKQGDMAFFYASGGKVPGITGIMEVVKEHEPDRTAWDENAYGYVENEKNRDKWCVVHVEFRNKLTKPVTRPELVAATKEGGPLAKMQEFTAARLSVSKVSEEEWVYINSLVEGFEDEDDAVMKDTSGAEEGNVEDNDDENDASSNLPGTAGSPPIESDLPPQEVPTTDTIFPAEPEQKTSMPVIETSSRPTSRSSALGGLAIKPSSSRAGSLAPPAGRRSRSKTPSARAGSVQPPSSAIVQDGTGMNAITEE